MVSLVSGQGYFLFLYRRTKHNIHNWEGGGKENKHRLGLAPSARRKKFMTLLHSFLCICELSWVCIWAKLPQSHQERWPILSRWPTQPLGLQVLAVGFPWLLLTTLSCWLPCSVWLPSSVDCLLLFCSGTLLSLVLFQSCGKSRMQTFCVGFVPKQTKGSSDWHWHLHPQKRMPSIVSHRKWNQQPEFKSWMRLLAFDFEKML